MDSGGHKEPCVTWGPRSQPVNWQFKLERAKEGRPREGMPGHVHWSIYLKRLGRGQNRFGADADSAALDACAHWRNLANTIEPSRAATMQPFACCDVRVGLPRVLE